MTVWDSRGEVNVALEWKDLTLPVDVLDPADLHEDWAWALTPDMRPVLVSAFGDVFLQDARGHVSWINTIDAQVSEVAASSEAFNEALQDPEQLGLWFMPGLVEELHARGTLLGPNQCYGFRKAPFLGGEVTADNVEPTDIQAHLSATAETAHHVKDAAPTRKVRKPTLDE
jgi:hypothetical protein